MKACNWMTFFFTSLLLFLPSMAQSQSCEWVLRYGTEDIVDNRAFTQISNKFRKDFCSEYKRISRSNASGSAEAHYFGVGGQGSFSQSKYTELGEWSCSHETASMNSLELKTSLTKTMSPTVYESFNKCMELKYKGWRIDVKRIQENDAVSFSFSDNEHRARGHKLKITEVIADNKLFECSGEIWERFKKGKATKIKHNEKAFYCKRKTISNARPGEVSVPKSHIVIHTTKEQFAIEFSEKIIPPLIPVGYKVEGRYQLKTKPEIGSLYFDGDSSLSVYDQYGGCDGRDLAACRVSRNGDLRAFTKDSCNLRGKNGNLVRELNQTSTSIDNGVYTKCKIISVIYKQGTKEISTSK